MGIHLLCGACLAWPQPFLVLSLHSSSPQLPLFSPLFSRVARFASRLVGRLVGDARLEKQQVLNKKAIMADQPPPPGEDAGPAPPVQGRSVKVVVRVRPVTEGDGTSPTCNLLQCNGSVVALSAPNDKRAVRQFKFDAALGPSSTQVTHGHMQASPEVCN